MNYTVISPRPAIVIHSLPNLSDGARIPLTRWFPLTGAEKSLSSPQGLLEEP